MTYHMITYVRDAGRNKHQKPLWEMMCQCGQTTVVIASHVRTGKTKSCGCLARSGNRRSHGGRYHPLYATWCNIKARCDNPALPSYKNYGGRGITYCERWSDFAKFLADVGEKPFPEASLDRIDNNGNYEPENVRWANRSTQRRNSRGRLVPVEIDGETRLLNEWCRVYGISIGAVHRRINCGMSVEDAITKPKAARFL